MNQGLFYRNVFIINNRIFIALTSPGPDTAIIINQCSRKGRAAGIFTAIGIGSGILIHCILAVTGISLLAVNYPPIKIFISLIGGAYILYRRLIFYFRVIKNRDGLF